MNPITSPPTTDTPPPTLGLRRDLQAHLRACDVEPAAFVAHWYPGGVWHGDTCGCVDDRCIGHHHDPTDPCNCFESWVDEFLRATAQLRSDGEAAAQVKIAQARAALGDARLALVACGRDAEWIDQEFSYWLTGLSDLAEEVAPPQ